MLFWNIKAFKMLEDKDPESLSIWKWFSEESIKEFNKTYDLLGINNFDSWQGESFYNDKMESVATFSGCDKIDILTEDGLVAFCKNGKWGFVNTAGEVVLEPKYENARSFSNGLAAVCEDGKWGFVDKERNAISIPMKKSIYNTSGFASLFQSRVFLVTDIFFIGFTPFHL